MGRSSQAAFGRTILWATSIVHAERTKRHIGALFRYPCRGIIARRCLIKYQVQAVDALLQEGFKQEQLGRFADVIKAADLSTLPGIGGLLAEVAILCEGSFIGLARIQS